MTTPTSTTPASPASRPSAWRCPDQFAIEVVGRDGQVSRWNFARRDRGWFTVVEYVRGQVRHHLASNLEAERYYIGASSGRIPCGSPARVTV